MKLSYILVLLSICSWSDVSDGLTASLHHQDTVVPAGSHNCEGPVNLPYKILNYNTLYVCTHGLVSFGSPVTLPGDTIAHHTDTPVIAVNWHNFNTLHTTGRVYYRSTQSDTSLLASTSDVIQTALSHAGYNNFRSRWALVVTWLNVTASQSDGSSTFQLILTSDAQRNVMIFHYDTLSHSGKVGFNGRDGSNYYQHSAAELLTGTNAGFPGRWVFPVNTVPVRLVDSRGRPRQGRVEVLYNGTWGTVCDDGFTDISAKVICSQLDYGYLGYVLRTVHDAGTGPIWLDKVQCRGTEADLGQCSHLAWGHSECTHQQDVSIACYNRSIAATSTPHVGWFFALTGVILLVISAVVWKLYRYRITQSSDAHRTESVTAMDHEETMGVNSKVLDQKQQNIFERISSFWSEELQGQPEQLNGGDHDWLIQRPESTVQRDMPVQPDADGMKSGFRDKKHRMIKNAQSERKAVKFVPMPMTA